MLKNKKIFFLTIAFIFIFMQKGKVFANDYPKNNDTNFIDYIQVASTIYDSNTTIIPNQRIVYENSYELNENINLEDFQSSFFDKIAEISDERKEELRLEEEKKIREEINKVLEFKSTDENPKTYVEKYVVNGEWTGISKEVPSENSFKCYESYLAITNKQSKQYKLQQVAYTGDYGIRVVDGRYCVALGSFYSTSIGQYFDVVMENGSIIPCILGDGKADIHTDETNRKSFNGSVVEFIVSIPNLHQKSKQMGDLSFACSEFEGTIKEIIIYDKNYFN